MKKFFNELIEWFKESNRYKHLIGGAIWSAVFYTIAIVSTGDIWPSFWLTIISCLGIAYALEIKDWQHECEFDENDVLSTMFGSIWITLLGVLITYIVA